MNIFILLHFIFGTTFDKEEIIMPIGRDPDQKFIQLKNGVRVMLISSLNYSSSGVSLSLPIGNYDCPSNFGGIAHLLEHVILQGSEKFSKRNTLVNFCKINNSSYSARTNSENTVYSLCFNTTVIESALEIFSNFFIAPTLTKEAIESEIEAIESEYLNGKNVEGDYFYSLLQKFMKNDIPESRFNFGNRNTLYKEDIEKNLREFWRNNYDPKKMAVCIFSSLPLSVLEKFSKKFEKIPSIEKVTFNTKSEQIFEKKFYMKLIKYKPKCNYNQRILRIAIECREVLTLFKQNPVFFLHFMIFENPKVQSLESILFQKGFALSFTFAYDKNFKNTIICFKIKLTEEGYKNYNTVISIISKYIKNIVVSKDNFDFCSKFNRNIFDQKIIKIEDIGRSMLLYPNKYVYLGGLTFEVYDEELLTYFKNDISDCSKWLIFLTGNEEKYDCFDNLYDLKYSVSEKIEIIKDYEGELHNFNYYEDNGECLELKNFDKYKIELPENIKFEQNDFIKIHFIEKTENGNIYYSYSDNINDPNAKIKIILKSNDILNNYAETLVFFNCIQSIFIRKYKLALYNSKVELDEVEINPQFVEITFTGFPNRINEIIDLFFKEMKNIENANFKLMKELLISNQHFNLSNTPRNRVINIFLSNIINGFLSTEKLLIKLNNLNFEKFQKFSSNFKFVNDIVATNNISYAQLKNLNDCISSYSKSYESYSNLETFKKNNCYEYSFETEDQNNNVISIFYEINYLPRDVAIANILKSYLEAEFYSKFRNEKNIGYVIYLRLINILGKEWLQFLIQSENDVKELKQEILNFISEFKETLSNACLKELENIKNGLIRNINSPMKNINDLSNNISLNYYKENFGWYNKYNFDINYSIKLAEAIQEITLNDLLIAYDQIFSNPKIVFSIRK